MTNEEQSERVDKVLAQHGKISYLEIPALYALDSGDFYESVFGWAVERRAPDNVSFFDGSGQLLGRFIPDRAPASTPGFLPYIYVSDVQATVVQIEACGGVVVSVPYEEGNLTVATFRDPAGNVLGVWQET